MGSEMFHLQMDQEESLKHYVVNYELCYTFYCAVLLTVELLAIETRVYNCNYMNDIHW